MIKRNVCGSRMKLARGGFGAAVLLCLLCGSRMDAASEITGSETSAGKTTHPVAAMGETPATKLPPVETGADSAIDPINASGYAGEMYKIGLGWHPTALQDLALDKFGLVNWVAALKEKQINPRSGIDPGAEEIPPFDLNIVMPAKTGMIEGAYFPHSTHTTWLACESCHTKIFIPLAGANDLNMSRIAAGKACGVCHGKVAFPLNDCERCHVPQHTPAAAASDNH